MAYVLNVGQGNNYLQHKDRQRFNAFYQLLGANEIYNNQ